MSDADDARHGPVRAAEHVARGDTVGDDPSAVEFGRTLRAARESADLSVADVAKALKVEEQIIEALEAEHYADLPPRPYIRGYVQRYARLVGLDAAAVTSGFKTVEKPTTVSPTVVPRSRWTFVNDFARERWGMLYGSIVLVFIVVVAGALWWAWSGETAKQAESDLAETPGISGQDATPLVGDGATVPPLPPAAAPESSDAAMPDSASDPAADPLAARSESSDAAMPGATAEDAADPLAVAPESPDAGAPASVTGVADPLAADGASATGVGDADPNAQAAVDAERQAKPDLLSIVFQEDSWVEVRDQNGDLVHGDLGRGGDTVTLRGKAPFDILVGYAAGVEISFNGDPVALEPGTRGDVARLVVGR
ncbi:MAG: DUF4115 domain-containing protein [Gammaproteobacteria bacterium]|nr:DUF4115 domain-containing protein [Gammaproteobacteria bacterium]